jgi:alkyldihydroxyacetonephosphate synthase
MTKSTDSRIVPARYVDPDVDGESRGMWGFRDSRFEVLPNGSVRFTGSRYELAGHELPDLLPFFTHVMGVELDTSDRHHDVQPARPDPPRLNEALVDELRRALPADALSTDDAVRVRHGHGHTVEEVYAVRFERLGRVPDLVVFPADEAEVGAIVAAAACHDVMLVPYGGGTNVTEALRCPEEEARMIVSVDLRRLNRIQWIDPVNAMACIEAGALGRNIEAQLAQHGFTLGHEPDSIEFSTLGGWIATNASGMKKNRYGNIEDLVLDVHAITPIGRLERTTVAPRESVGVDPRRLLFGSEGNLGIITSAVVKIFPLPEVKRHDALLFPNFEQGVRFMYELTRAGAVPASVRLVDNVQFHFGQKLRPKAAGPAALQRRLETFFLSKVRRYDLEQIVAATLLYEGSKAEVAAQRKAVHAIARRHNGMHAGAENGRKGYQLTFAIAYLRDFGLGVHIMGESLETSVRWTVVTSLCDRVKRRVAAEHAQLGLPGRPFVSSRVTQVYQTGVCVYFYIIYYHKGVEHPTDALAQLERAARDEILLSGGSLSHHHGVGKLRRSFLPRVLSPAALQWNALVKQAVDPGNIFGIRNHTP